MKHNKMKMNLSILNLDFYLLKKGEEEKKYVGPNDILV